MRRDLTHVGLIPDGMRRWAEAHDATLIESYQRAASKVVDILLTLQGHGVQTVSVYFLSRANLGRRPDELAPIFAAQIEFFSTLVPAYFDPATTTLRVHGDRNLLPERYISAVQACEEAMTGDGFGINILAAYDANDELRRALAERRELAGELYIGEVDMVIRTTPEPLLSGFLPLQSQYALLHFLSTPLNELEDKDIDDLVEQYRQLPQLRGR